MITEKGKTSTITIHHDRCDVSKWTIAEWRTLASFVKDAGLQQAAALSRLGMQLVLSDHHEPTGGTLEALGWAEESELPNPMISDDLSDIVNDDCEIVPVVQVYRGPTQYAVMFTTGDENGDVDGHEIEVKNTLAEAQEFLKSLLEAEPAH
jgi:hypothetical protein